MSTKAAVGGVDHSKTGQLLEKNYNALRKDAMAD